MDNVIKFPTKEEVVVDDPVMQFIHKSLLPWAIENQIDIDSMHFKLNAAAIMTCLQMIVLNDDL